MNYNLSLLFVPSTKGDGVKISVREQNFHYFLSRQLKAAEWRVK